MVKTNLKINEPLVIKKPDFNQVTVRTVLKVSDT